MSQRIHIHIGPHETDSDTVLKSLLQKSDWLLNKYGLRISSEDISNLILKVVESQDGSVIVDRSQQLADIVRQHKGDWVISCVDLAGVRPGEENRRRVYPALWARINIIRKLLNPFDLSFYFFERNPEIWLKEIYLFNSERLERFASYEQFRKFLKPENLWDEILEKSETKLPSKFFRLPHLTSDGISAALTLIQGITGDEDIDRSKFPVHRTENNELIGGIRSIESINGSSATDQAKRRAKNFIINEIVRPVLSPAEITKSSWGSRPQKPDWLPEDLESLWQRVNRRVHWQDQQLLLPEPLSDLRNLRTQIIAAPSAFPSGGRADMKNQKSILSYRLSGFPETCLLLGLTISYLRRSTAYTEHASFLFQRLWEEEYDILLGTLPTRWLISTFQTFLDHGINESQKVIGGSAYFYANMIKAYEAERALEGRESDEIYPNTQPNTKLGFPGMDRFELGGTDLMLNTNALLLELSVADERSGRVVQEFLGRLKSAQSIFSRMDRSRMYHQTHKPPFDNCWSFFEEPE
ncbi:hypothetical protein [Palleronia caenipelagi]|uniref:Uncharacterized protein n=1 Tax=Palleronia caenipelagi TaxID=2489174 RepID=A0A547PM11_9RHOB|nr:hypothetical protein [Palleronia caenipelagi]TRD15189.1 hypothetical protein FEV53_17515 [Palleronia caenipelagi]